MRLSLLALLMTIAGAAVQLWTQVPNLPPRVATHFGAGGVADGWSSRTTFTWFSLVLVASFALLPLLVHLLLRFLPASLINIPHRDYWLADTRRRQTMRRLGAWMEWYGAGSVLFALGITQLTIRANLLAPSPTEARLDGGFVLLLVLYLAGTALWIVVLYRWFRKPPERGAIEPA